ncbi:MAG: signal recognition particle receptor subunit alpha, partial [Oscillospiraceae bacterium]|nr:signal recognition particle receptor subunit alpha [Oscillospiraceae bacterium]
MGLFDRLKTGLQKTKSAVGGQLDGLFGAFTRLDDDFFDELEETLILADMGASASAKVVGELRARCKSDGIKEGAVAKE